jgi:signal transduction histidine kinase
VSQSIRRRDTLLFRLLWAYLLPTLALLFIFGLLALYHSEDALEESLGRRLMDVAEATTTQINPAVITFLSPGDDQSLSAKRLRRKLQVLQKRTGVARIFVIDEKLRIKADTQTKTRIGDKHYHAQADKSELAQVFRGQAKSSVLFRGADGHSYKTGYAPLTDEGRVIAAVGVEGSAAFFTTIRRLGGYLWGLGSIIALLMAISTLLIARRITKPLVSLAAEASRIGAGEMERPVAVDGRGEAALLARTMNDMRRDLQAREEQLQLMLSGIAHEVRNPLGGMTLFSGLLREELADNPEQLEMIERIEKELDYLKKVVNDFLAYARRMPIEKAPQKLDELLSEVAQLATAEAQAADVKLSLTADEAVALGDAEQLRRVVLNLASNAIAACEAGGEVALRCGVADGAPFVAVEDNGTGIPEELREKIFSPFFTTREKGTGLGLALSKKTISEHGGELEISTEPGKGTTITVRLRPPE